MADDLIAVIATAGRPELLRRTLTSLAECQKPDIYRETVVVENGPKAGSEEVVRLYHSSLKARYVYVPLANKSHALNTVLEMVGDCLIFFTDDDVRMHPGTLCAYAETAAGFKGEQFYGGPTDVDYEREPPEWLKAYLPPSARGWRLDEKFREEPVFLLLRERPQFLGCNWAAFVSDLRNAGGFDERIGPGSATGSTGQEIDMQTRLWKRGVRAVYVPKAMVSHYVPVQRCSPKWAARRAYRNGIHRGIRDVSRLTTIMGFPRWMVRTWLMSGLNLIRAVGHDPCTRFDAYYKFMNACGYMHGSRIAFKNGKIGLKDANYRNGELHLHG